MPGVFLLAPGPVFIDPNQQTVHNNATVTTSGSVVYTGFGVREITLVVNIKAAPTGGTPSISYSMQEVDPGDQTTVLGTSVTGATLISAGTQVISLPLTVTGTVKVSWTVTGSTPSFTGVYATVVTKISTVASGLDGTGNEHPLFVDSSGALVANVPGVATEATLALARTDLDKRFAGGKKPWAGNATSSGDTAIATPSSGKTLTLHWILITASLNNSLPEIFVTVRLGSKNIYNDYLGKFSHWEPITADNPNDPLILNLDIAASKGVAWNATTTEA